MALLCTQDEHVLLSCHGCRLPKVAPMDLFPYCSPKCRNAANRKSSTE